MSEIRFDSAAIQNIVAKALMDELGPEARDKLITQALEYLIAAPKSTSYGHVTKSPLQRAFEEAAAEVANSYVRELFKKDEFRGRVDLAILNFVNEQFEDATWLYESVGKAVGIQVGDMLRDRARD